MVREGGMSKDGRYNRLGERYGGRIFFTLFIFISAAFLVSFFWFIFNSHGRRLTLAVAADPTTIATFDFSAHKLTLLSFPSASEIEGVHGVGQYSLASLWQLGQIDPKNPKLLSESLTQSAGLPIEKYLGFRNGVHYSDGLGSLRQIFSGAGILNFLRGQFINNLSLSEFVSLITFIKGLRPDDITKLDGSVSLYPKKLPDGMTVSVVDPNKLDALIGENFEDDLLRGESLRVAVYNSSDTPELGSKVETLLTHSGILVILVGNDTPEVGRCEMSGTKSFLESETAKFIEQTYGCKPIKSVSGRADLTVKVGHDFEQLFLPKQ